MIDVRQLEPLPDTTEGLAKLLLGFRLKSARNEVKHHPIVLEMANRLEEFDDMDPATKRYCNDMRRMFGPERLVGLLAYHQLRKWIQSHQLSHDISGIQIVSETVAGQQISYPMWGEQLALLDSDIPRLKAAVPALVNDFERLAKLLPEYLLTKEVWGEADDPDRSPSTISEVRTFSEMAWLHTESMEWQQPNDKGEVFRHWVDRDPPDEIHLIFRLGRPDSGNRVAFVLLKPER